MATSAVNSRAATGFKNAANYDTYRPSYPPEAVDKLLAHLGVANQEDAQIIELACGTGKFTELLAARPENFEVLAVEPHTEMREELVKKNLGERVKVLDGHAGSMPIEESWGDCLIAAQVRILCFGTFRSLTNHVDNYRLFTGMYYYTFNLRI